MRHGDIIHYSWVLDCCAQKNLLHLQPKYFLFIADSSKRKFQEEIDSYSDYYYWDIDLADIKQIFSNMDGSRDSQCVRHYKKKYCPTRRWCLFQDCCIYFCEAIPNINTDLKAVSELALRRMKLEVIWHGGEVSSDLSCATHLVAYSMSLSETLFDVICDRCPSLKKNLLHGQRLQVVRHQWLEDSLDQSEKLPEDAYNLRPDTLVSLKMESSAQGSDIPMVVEHVDKHTDKAPFDVDRTRKRGRSAKMMTKGRAVAKPARRMCARIRRKPAKLYLDESENSASSDGNISADDAETSRSHGVQENDCVKDEHGILRHSGHIDEILPTKDKGIPDDTGRCLETSKSVESSPKKGTLDERNSQWLDLDNSMEEGRTGTSEKLEVTYDPVQAMLLDMIPSLSQKKTETEKSAKEEKQKPKPDVNPVKRRVSYKDIAGQLLGDY